MSFGASSVPLKVIFIQISSHFTDAVGYLFTSMLINISDIVFFEIYTKMIYQLT